MAVTEAPPTDGYFIYHDALHPANFELSKPGDGEACHPINFFFGFLKEISFSRTGPVHFLAALFFIAMMSFFRTI